MNRLLNFVSYVGRYTEDNGITNQNTVDANDTSVVCATGDEEIFNEETNNTVAQSQQKSSSEFPNYVLPEIFPNVASILEHWDAHIEENKRRFGFR